ncbi:hypothetical protein [Parendozoicomonas sp. Alg238-R29]|uniref:IS1/IS1595 family N-terminal zinc-binding domain-containing protein n=1 Tax=Parendozoicomonas sp. Alg238-R29 TaxID=2993446 RepID=UPI00248EDA51|nr:hypothetical protein [Parendozoicomonas sp. Alg238-R29]
MTTDFRQLLESCTLLSDRQKDTLRSVLLQPRSHDCNLYQRLEKNFAAHPCCHHCSDDNVRKFGFQSSRQRYQCKSCQQTFNTLTGTTILTQWGCHTCMLFLFWTSILNA